MNNACVNPSGGDGGRGVVVAGETEKRYKSPPEGQTIARTDDNNKNNNNLYNCASFR